MKLDWKAASIIAVAVLAVGGMSSLSAQQQATLVRLFLGNAVVSASNPLPVAATITPSGTQDINIKQVQGAVPSATNPLWVSPATASTPWAISIASGQVAAGAYASGAFASGSIASGAMVDLGAIADAAATAGSTGSVSAKLRLMTTQLGTINTTLGAPMQATGGTVGLVAGSAIVGKVGIDQTTPGTTNLVSLNTTPSVANGNSVVSAPSSESLAAIAHSTSVTAAESCRVLKASAGNLYGLRVSIAAVTGYVMVFDATSAPSDGAVTTLAIPAVRVVSDGTSGWYADDFSPPMRMATGITVCFSSTGPFSKTASATAAIAGQVQ